MLLKNGKPAAEKPGPLWVTKNAGKINAHSSIPVGNMPLRGGYLIVAYGGDGKLQILNLGLVTHCQYVWERKNFDVRVLGVTPTLHLTVMDPT